MVNRTRLTLATVLAITAALLCFAGAFIATLMLWVELV